MANPRVAILGANGQVGAELCLLLSRRADIDLVPVCRNRSGSAFLRWMGIACRHGKPADSAEAARLIGDCDVVINSALATGTPAQIRQVEDQLVWNAYACSLPRARVIHFSTQSVYGDPTEGELIRWKNPYGRAKLLTEKRVRAAQRRFDKPTWILRLGHVCGALQEISQGIRDEIRRATVVLPERDVPSNTVYTVSIVDALMHIIDGKAAPGTYDLMNHPQWTWREVYAHEAQANGLSLQPAFASNPSRPSPLAMSKRLLIAAAWSLRSSAFVRHQASTVLAHLPLPLNQRAQAWWYRRRARAEMSALAQTQLPAEHLSWVNNSRRVMPGLVPTTELLRTNPYDDLALPPATSWPADLPDCARVQVG